ncbi:hypothetical protein K8R32_05310 [bacterium]|nr:hypothetical protein [bacterium]
MAVIVATNSGKVEVEFKEGMFLKDALKAAKVKPKKSATITVNNEEVGNKNVEIMDKDLIVVTPKVGNG